VTHATANALVVTATHEAMQSLRRTLTRCERLQSTDSFDDCSLAELRTRRSEKWAMYPADVLPAFVAEMDVALAAPIKRALIDAIERGDTGYAHPAGLATAFADFARAWFDWTVDPDRVFLVPDVTVGLAEVLRLTNPPGSGVVINTPPYPPFTPTIIEYGRRVVDVPLRGAAHGWDLDLDGLARAFQAGARAYLLCNPHNPTGRVFSRDDLERVAALARRYDVVVVADENHAPLTLPGVVHTPFVSLGEEIVPRAATVISAAKAWNVAGLKCAVVVAGSESMRAAGGAAARSPGAGGSPGRAGGDRRLPRGAALAHGPAGPSRPQPPAARRLARRPPAGRGLRPAGGQLSGLAGLRGARPRR